MQIHAFEINFVDAPKFILSSTLGWKRNDFRKSLNGVVALSIQNKFFLKILKVIFVSTIDDIAYNFNDSYF